MNRGRQTDDFEERKAAYDEVQVQLAEDVPYVWLTHTLWALITDDTVRNVGGWTLPDGDPALAFLNGRYPVTEVLGRAVVPGGEPEVRPRVSGGAVL
ncbi:MAG: hypothetical protein U5R31_00180 [Acidimicrobiia bacterium]|nr:hypothetical protein [Acidimicrobiia bacterium]